MCKIYSTILKNLNELMFILHRLLLQKKTKPYQTWVFVRSLILLSSFVGIIILLASQMPFLSQLPMIVYTIYRSLGLIVIYKHWKNVHNQYIISEPDPKDMRPPISSIEEIT